MSVHRVCRLHMINAYLVREDDGLTLVDALLAGADCKLILKEAAGLGAPIRRIALTHAHGDHIGALDTLVARLGADQVEVSISASDAKLLRKDTSP